MQFKLESATGLKVINDFEAMMQYIPKSSTDCYSSELISGLGNSVFILPLINS